MLTYRELRNRINQMTEEQLDCDVTIVDSGSDEFYTVDVVSCEDTDGVLDHNHPYLIIEESE